MLPRSFIFPRPRSNETPEDYSKRLIISLEEMYESITREFGTYFEEAFTWNPGSLADGAGETSTDIPAPGAALGDYVAVSSSLDLQGIICTAYVHAEDVVHIRLQNETGGTIDLASSTFRVKVVKRE
uniref:Uncharacterized protein n=1 Tax=viral metagenome TaxID=1070528 RepID=A0A6M3KAK0_9ZZZZ